MERDTSKNFGHLVHLRLRSPPLPSTPLPYFSQLIAQPRVQLRDIFMFSSLFSLMLSLEDFFCNSERSGYQISPDGRHISYLAPYKDRMNVFVQSIDDNAQLGIPLRLTSETERSIGGYMWESANRILYMKDEGGDENYHLYGVRLDGSDLRCYTDFPGVRVSIIDDLEDIPGQIIIGMNQRNPEVFDPYRLDLENGTLTQLCENPGNYQGWCTDHNGCLRIVYAIVDGVNTQILYRDTENEDFRPILTTNFKEEVNICFFTPDNQNVWAISNLGRDRAALVLLNPRTGEEVEELYAHERYDVGSVSYSRRYKRLLSAYCTGHREPVRYYFDAETRQRRERIEAHFPHHRVAIADTDRSEENCLLYVGSDRTRGSYYFYNIQANQPLHIADTAPWIREEEMTAMHAVSYTTSDGFLIEAYLSLPPGVVLSQQGQQLRLSEGQTPLPVIVNPHGGPWARDCWGYSSEVQFLCSRGYAVFQMNFRGSTGYGRKFLEASYKQWGLKMQDDITEGVHWLIKQGIADASRIAIYGGSYGGYATLAGICFTPELYRCAIDYVGVSNLFTFMNTIPPYWRPMLEMMYEQVGHPELDREQLAATSPALHADKIRCPLFIAQGSNDPRVNKAESDQMVKALQERGIEVEYMVKDNEGHGFRNQENRFEFYRAMERFLAKHLA